MIDERAETPEEVEEVEAPETEEVEAPSDPERDWEAEAREDGWVPQDEWKGDPAAWRPADEFVKRGEELAPILKARLERERRDSERRQKEFEDRLKRMEAMNRQALERQAAQHKAALEAIEAGKKQALDDGDVQEYHRLSEREKQLGDVQEVPKEEAAQPAADPALESWVEQNPWFKTDPLARAAAIAAAEVEAQAGVTDVGKQLAAAQAAVKKRFPEHFGAPVRTTTETAGRAPRKTRERGVADLPKEAQQGFDELVRMGIYKPEDKPKYAKAYWEHDT